MEYYFQCEIGLLALLPRAELPTVVELHIAGKACATYSSAETAAQAVASRLTGHADLDALPVANLPAKLSDWTQSLPHHFKTGSPPSTPKATPPSGDAAAPEKKFTP